MVRKAASSVREDFAESINQVAYGGQRIVLHRRGRNLVAMVSMADLELLEAIEDRIDVDAARKALRERGRNIPLARLKSELGL